MPTILEKVDAVLAIGTVLATVMPFVPRLEPLSRYGKTLSRQEAWQLYFPKCWFAHFYVIAAVLPLTLILLILSESVPGLFLSATVSTDRTLSLSKVTFVLTLNAVQGWKRLYESLFVFKSHPDAKIPVTSYLIGIAYYFIVDCQLIANLDPQDVSPLPLLPSALFVFLFGAFVLDQASNHSHIASLVKYNIPQKGLFRYVAGAHYLDEICLYALQAVYLRTRTSTLLAVYVCVSLTLVSRNSYEFYCEKDAKYSLSHKVVVPFVY